MTPNVHAEVLTFDLSERISGYNGSDAQLFTEFATQRCVRGLSVLDVAAGKIPAVRIPPTRRHSMQQETAIAAP